MRLSLPARVVVALVLAGVCTIPSAAAAGTRLSTLCRVKGQEENTLHALGLVVGLNGTGDGKDFLPTIRNLALLMEKLGTPIVSGNLKELGDAKNVALVHVAATVPAAGARQGDRIDCTVSSFGSASSLAGGRLVVTPMLGPIPSPDGRVYAVAEGDITVEDSETPTRGRIHGGCRLEEEFRYQFVKDGKVTLVLKEEYADFQVAQEVADMINNRELVFQTSGELIARALDQVNIEVEVPRQYLNDPDGPALFLSQLWRQELLTLPLSPRVVINQRAGSIVISGDAEIRPVAITHRNIVVETGAAAMSGGFIGIDTADAENPQLKSLVEALNAVHVPTKDVIEIIKLLKRNGALSAELILQ